MFSLAGPAHVRRGPSRERSHAGYRSKERGDGRAGRFDRSSRGAFDAWDLAARRGSLSGVGRRQRAAEDRGPDCRRRAGRRIALANRWRRRCGRPAGAGHRAGRAAAARMPALHADVRMAGAAADAGAAREGRARAGPARRRRPARGDPRGGRAGTDAAGRGRIAVDAAVRAALRPRRLRRAGRGEGGPRRERTGHRHLPRWSR